VESVFEGSLRLILTRAGALLFGSLQVIKYIIYISRGQCVGMVTALPLLFLEMTHTAAVSFVAGWFRGTHAEILHGKQAFMRACTHTHIHVYAYTRMHRLGWQVKGSNTVK